MLFVYLIVLTFVAVQTEQNTTDLEVPPRNVPSVEDVVAELKQQIREESLSLREEMYSMLGGMTKGDGAQSNFMDIIKELISEVKYYQQLTLEQTQEIEQLESYREATLEKLDEVQLRQESTLEKLNEVQTNHETTLANHETTLEKLQANHETTLANHETTLERLNEVHAKQESTLEQTTNCSEMLPGITSKLDKLEHRMNIVREEVRLISQHKLTWQNHTSSPYQPDFAVDGVYTRVNDVNGHNPISYSYITTRNNVLIIDLGGLFKIHTVKVWGRIDAGGLAHMIGVFVYADGTLLGGIAEAKSLSNINVAGTVFGRKIILKQSVTNYLGILEVQVFGNGPYGDDEV